MGPCELTDLIGQDVNFSVTQSVYQEFFTSHVTVQASFKKNWSMQVLGAVSQKQGFIPITKNQYETFQPQAVAAASRCPYSAKRTWSQIPAF